MGTLAELLSEAALLTLITAFISHSSLVFSCYSRQCLAKLLAKKPLQTPHCLNR